jgi:hypothetical protein
MPFAVGPGQTEVGPVILLPGPFPPFETGPVNTDVVILLLVTEVTVAQGALDVITTVTAWLFVRFVVVNVGLFVPAFAPFTFHWYVGDAPPLVGVAVKVTELPEQILLSASLEEIITDGVTTGFKATTV